MKKEIQNNSNYNEKFIVINKKRLIELAENTKHCNCREAMCGCLPEFSSPEGDNLLKALNKFNKAYEERVGKEMNQKYLVVNQDEEYAKDIWEIIQKNHKNESLCQK